MPEKKPVVPNVDTKSGEEEYTRLKYMYLENERLAVEMHNKNYSERAAVLKKKLQKEYPDLYKRDTKGEDTSGLLNPLTKEIKSKTHKESSYGSFDSIRQALKKKRLDELDAFHEPFDKPIIDETPKEAPKEVPAAPVAKPATKVKPVKEGAKPAAPASAVSAGKELQQSLDEIKKPDTRTDTEVQQAQIDAVYELGLPYEEKKRRVKIITGQRADYKGSISKANAKYDKEHPGETDADRQAALTAALDKNAKSEAEDKQLQDMRYKIDELARGRKDPVPVPVPTAAPVSKPASILTPQPGEGAGAKLFIDETPEGSGGGAAYDAVNNARIADAEAGVVAGRPAAQDPAPVAVNKLTEEPAPAEAGGYPDYFELGAGQAASAPVDAYGLQPSPTAPAPADVMGQVPVAPPAAAPPAGEPVASPVSRPGLPPAPAPVPAPAMAAAGVSDSGAVPVAGPAPVAAPAPGEQPVGVPPTEAGAAPVAGGEIKYQPDQVAGDGYDAQYDTYGLSGSPTGNAPVDVMGQAPVSKLSDKADSALMMRGFAPTAEVREYIKNHAEEFDTNKDGEFSADEIADAAEQAQEFVYQETMDKFDIDIEEQRTIRDTAYKILDEGTASAEDMQRAADIVRGAEAKMDVLLQKKIAYDKNRVLDTESGDSMAAEIAAKNAYIDAQVNKKMAEYDNISQELAFLTGRPLTKMPGESDEAFAIRQSAAENQKAMKIVDGVFSALFVGLGSFAATLTKSPNFALQIFEAQVKESFEKERMLRHSGDEISRSILSLVGKKSSAKQTTLATYYAMLLNRNKVISQQYAPASLEQRQLKAQSDAVIARYPYIKATERVLVDKDERDDVNIKIQQGAEERKSAELVHRVEHDTFKDENARVTQQAKLLKEAQLDPALQTELGAYLAGMTGVRGLLPEFVRAKRKWDTLDTRFKDKYGALLTGQLLEGWLKNAPTSSGEAASQYILQKLAGWTGLDEDARRLQREAPEVFDYMAKQVLVLSAFMKARSGSAVSDVERAFLSQVVPSLAGDVGSGVNRIKSFGKSIYDDAASRLKIAEANNKNVVDIASEFTRLYYAKSGDPSKTGIYDWDMNTADSDRFKYTMYAPNGDSPYIELSKKAADIPGPGPVPSKYKGTDSESALRAKRIFDNAKKKNPGADDAKLRTELKKKYPELTF